MSDESEEMNSIHLDDGQDQTSVDTSTEEARCVPEAHSTAQRVEKGDVPTSEAATSEGEAQHLCIESNEQSEEHSVVHLKGHGPAVSAEVVKPDEDVALEKDSTAVDVEVEATSQPATLEDDEEAAASTKSTGGGTVPRDHTREPESQSSHKRKRFVDDEGPTSSKRTAFEGRYIARHKVCSLLFAL
jgi:hypothetical protein